MLDQKKLNRILFMDIETTSQKPNFCDLSDHQKEIFKKRFKKEFSSEVEKKSIELLSKKKESDNVSEDTMKTTKKKPFKNISKEKILKSIEEAVGTELYNIKAPIFPEFGRIICISVGAMWKNDADDFYNIKINTFANEDEKVLLEEFKNHPKLGLILNNIAGKYDKNQDNFWAMCAHNGRIFDFPYITKRMIINGLKPPSMFDYAHLKPWEQTHIIDTKEAWSFGIWDAVVSLESLSEIFGVTSSKSDIDGSEVKDIFWVEKDLDRIAKYCEKDVIALATNYLRMKSMSEEVVVFEQTHLPTQVDLSK